MTETSTNPTDEIGILLTNPRAYLVFRQAFMVGRGSALNRRLTALSGVGPGDRVADIGCGPGDLLRNLAERAGVTGTATGIDPSPEMLRYAREHSAHLPRCAFELAPAQQLPLADASVDVLTCTFVMHHIPQARRPDAFAEMFRVLRPGGRLLLADTHPHGRIVSTLIRAMSRSAARQTDDHAAHTDPLAAIDIRRYRDLLRTTGFHDVEFSTARPVTGVLRATKP
ncbi:class I SAM-dependent methyltransferase [Nocardia sp. NPDC127579]|uniref:class I SAM-dependent methyltransferase n=1 Tax=Nocardia sp. NPDC127579 TaxID=3345402 RepID=UPI003636EEE3